MCKPYLIPDFVTRATQGTGSESLEREVCMQGGAQLVLRQANVRPLPEQVTLAQFLSTNARIMAKLIREGRLRSQEELLDYLKYTADVGDYAQMCELPSVLLYDKEYRKKQARRKTKWGSDDTHLSTFYLHRRRRGNAGKPQPPSQRAGRPPWQTDRCGVEICRSCRFIQSSIVDRRQQLLKEQSSSIDASCRAVSEYASSNFATQVDIFLQEYR